MKPSLSVGLKHSFSFEVPSSKTVPHLFDDAPELEAMPEVFATAFMIGLMERTCVQLLAPHLEEGEGSVGTQVDVAHTAATPPGLTVTVEAECIDLKGPRATFSVRAHDGIDEIGKGTHQRFIVGWNRFERALAPKLAETAKRAKSLEEAPH